jgi:hypothetical protein
MVSWVAPSPPAVIGGVLVWAGLVKLLSRHASAAALRSALPRVVGDRRALPAYRTVAIVELVVGSALLLPPALRAEAGAAAAVNAGFLAYLTYARASVPESSCGCLSAHRTPIGVRSFARAATLLLAAVAAATTTTSWPEALLAQPVLGAATLLAEVGLIAGLSSELDRYWLLPLRRLRVRLTHPLPAGSTDVPLASTIDALHHSDAYRRVASLLTSDVREHWDEGDWRIVCYSAHLHGQRLSAVFAVPRLRFEPAAVRVALVDESTNTTVFSLDEAADALPDPVAQTAWPVPEPATAA